MDSCSTGSSTGSNFRELDVEFLQTQAKIWIEQVLEKRFDDKDTLVDVLADGEILFKVSKIISELMRRRFGAKIDSPDTFLEATAFAKPGGKYLPYSNVDAFLKVCQKLGLTGIDLFSPPDVVEKRDIRRVCLCIRALSKKARLRHLDVPDFDVVTHGLFMPTEMVDSIRKYLEKTRYIVSSKSEYRSGPGSRGTFGNNNELFFTGPFELSPEDPDEAESKLKSPDSGSSGSLLEGNAGFTTDIYSTSPRSPIFKSEGVADIVNEFMESSVLCISDKHASGHTCKECADSTSVSVHCGIEESGTHDVEVGCPTTVSELDSLDVGLKNPLKLDSVDADCTDTLPVDSVVIDRIIVSNVNDVDYYYMNEPKTGSVDINFVNQPKSEFVVTDRGYMPEADIFDMVSANVPKEDSVDINCVNVPKENNVVKAMSWLEADSVDVDCTNVLKPGTIHVHGSPNTKKVDTIKLGWANSPEADGVEVDMSDDLKGDRMNSDYLYMQQSETVDADHALIANGSIDQLLHWKADSGHVNNEENQNEIEKIIPRKDEPVEKSTTCKHNRRRPWMPFFAGGLAVFGTVITIMQARKLKDLEVKKGDTLSQISKRVGKSSWKELVRINPEIKNPDLIYPGDRLKLK